MIQFQYFSTTQRDQHLSIRKGETKLGQKMSIVQNMDDLPNSRSLFVIIGACEDIGVKGNGGIGGANTAWPLFLKTMLNIQENRFFNAGNLLILGNFHTREAQGYDAAVVEALDTELAIMIRAIIAIGKIPILIGGGHNNALGMLSGSSKAVQQTVNVINLDPHADLRMTDSRHSGNGFSFAKKNGWLHKYAMLGLHEAYNNSYILDQLQDEQNNRAIFFEDIFMRQKLTWEEAMNQSLHYVSEDKFGVELDMDSIENTLSSAMTPLGIDSRMAYRYLYRAGQDSNSIYLHLAESIARRDDGLEQKTIGKLLAYFVQAFIKGKLERT